MFESSQILHRSKRRHAPESLIWCLRVVRFYIGLKAITENLSGNRGLRVFKIRIGLKVGSRSSPRKQV